MCCSTVLRSRAAQIASHPYVHETPRIVRAFGRMSDGRRPSCERVGPGRCRCAPRRCACAGRSPGLVLLLLCLSPLPVSSAAPCLPPPLLRSPQCSSSCRPSESSCPLALLLVSPAMNLLCPSLPATPCPGAVVPPHIWGGRGRGSPVRSSGDPLPRAQAPRAIWRGAGDTAPDSHPRLSREVGGKVGDESRGRGSEAIARRCRC